VAWEMGLSEAAGKKYWRKCWATGCFTPSSVRKDELRLEIGDRSTATRTGLRLSLLVVLERNQGNKNRESLTKKTGDKS
jgi:hypothetical protein